MKIFLTVVLSSLLFTNMAYAEVKPQQAIFAGGCFWCMEPPFEKLDGVVSVVSGYIGGNEQNPAYKQVARGLTGHTEAVEITFHPGMISYEELLDVFWMQVDPTVDDRQFVDTGKQYRPGIFYTTNRQKAAAEKSKQATEALGLHGKPFKLEITQANTFWPAEDYHQDYYKKNPLRYNFYRFNSGRDQYLKRVWGDKYKK
jgi:methionine-S-sulfoxide reductase